MSTTRPSTSGCLTCPVAGHCPAARRRRSARSRQRAALLLLLLLACGVAAFAQRPAGHSFSVGLNPGWLQRQDLVFSPLVHHAISPLGVDLRYAARGKWPQTFGLRYVGYRPQAGPAFSYVDDGVTKTAGPHVFTFVNADYTLGRSFARNRASITTVGVAVNLDVDLLNYAYGRTGNFGYFTSAGVGFFVDREWQMSKGGSFDLQVAVPVIGWISRSPYLVNDDEFIENIADHSELRSLFAFVADGRFRTFTAVQAATLSADYRYPLLSRVHVGLGLRLAALRTDDPRPLRSLELAIPVSLTFNW